MDNELIINLANDFKSHNHNILIVENNDGFLFREDVIAELSTFNIKIVAGSLIQQRIQFELRDNDNILILLTKDKDIFLEDIIQKSVSIVFFFEQYCSGYHLPSIVELDLNILEKLYRNKEIVKLTKQQTLEKIQLYNSKLTIQSYDVEGFKKELDNQINHTEINWNSVAYLIANAVLKTINTIQFDEVMNLVNEVNNHFQQNIENTYQQTKNSSAVKKPKIVSKILEYISFNFKKDKVALIVIDGLALWQYELLKTKLHNIKNEEVIYSWLPSITQLSRQAIFRGDVPVTDYRQGPISEEKLWKNYWKSKGLNEFEIRYQHENTDLTNSLNISKLALVFKDLDEKMHSSSDYKDLLRLTENWIERSKIIQTINDLLSQKFIIFLTTDHGNIEAKGWRGLQGREKLGTNKSGSRSERHIEYSEKWLSDEFIENNPDLVNEVVMEDQSIYFKSNLSFSNKKTVVTHGGAHILEVLIPFIEISNE